MTTARTVVIGSVLSELREGSDEAAKMRDEGAGRVLSAGVNEHGAGEAGERDAHLPGALALLDPGTAPAGQRKGVGEVEVSG
jgi:hypothetical protein